MTLVGGQISHRGVATQLGPELWLGRCAEWQGGKEITDTGEQASLGNEMLSGTQMALATVIQWPVSHLGYTYDTGL